MTSGSTSKRYAMAVDTRRCVGCNACVLACKAENDLPEHGFRDWIVIETRGEFPHLSQEIRSERCNHCEHPACVAACPTGASFVAEGGVVAVDPEMCTGCKACMGACPYNARYIHDDGFADKCTFCLHRVRDGKQPACVEICPTRTLVFGDTSDPDSEISRVLRVREHRTNKPELGLEPHVFFLR